MEKISSFQFFGLLILFQIGSYVIFGFASSAKQDAWLVALLGMGVGIVLVLMYLKIYRLYPGHDMIIILQKTLGKWVGKGIGLLYILAFIYVAGRVLRDFAELVTSFILPMTPLLLVLICLLFTTYYGLCAGIEVLGRLAEMLMIFFILALLSQIAFVAASGLVHLEFLLPIAHKKQEILKSLVPLGITVPFGECIAFLMLFHQVRSQNRLSWLLVGSVVFSGILLASVNIMGVSVLGPELFSRMVYPLLNTVQQAEIGGFIENIDALVVVYIGISAFAKVTVFVYAASLGTASVFGLEEYRTPLLPICIFVLLLSFFMAKNVAEHAFVGLQWVPWLLWIPLFIIIPLLILGIGQIRKGGNQDEGAQKA